MKHTEIFLKLAFLLMSIYFIVVRAVTMPYVNVFLLVCFFLGLVLIFNKNSSYGFKQTQKDLVMRRIEGYLLIAFAIAGYLFVLNII